MKCFFFAKPTRNSLRTLVVALGFTSATTTHAIDIDPGDYTALPAGTNLAMLYYQYATNDRLYANGERAPENAGLDTNIGIFRYVHFMEVGGYIVDPQILLPFGQVEAKGDLAPLGSTSGIADPILAATVWLVNDPENNHYLGITPFLQVPVGSYDNKRALNLGENRWAFSLQTGYIRGLTETLALDLAADVTLHGKNSDFGAESADLKQDPLYQFQGYLRHNLTQTWDVRGGLSYTYGGETKVDGQRQDDKTETLSATIGTGYFITPTVQVLANYGQDLSVENGFREEHRVNLRLLKVF
ncbi:transporter [Halomonas sp. Y3]|uniref:transporter n=1 Tax=Halomonas sp. Y3 TaxID=2956797 RepID=UPI00209F0DEF|nr:transporter [Halomonas sp. Y3]